jgi:sugar phosphate isomerase/epimerase
MRTALFTKLFGSTPVLRVGATCAELGFDSLDLLVRPGCTVDPVAADTIPDITRQLEEQYGIGVSMVTTDFTDPTVSEVESTLDGCARAGVQLIRLGYWHYNGQRPYADVLADARRHLDGLEKLAQKYQIRLAVQLHGGTIHASGATAAVLLEGRDPALWGAYPDPGNQAVQDGREDWRLTFDLLDPWLCCVGVKNGGWFPSTVASSGQRTWQSDWLGIADGMVPWADILAYLQNRFAGILSFHSHYEMPLPQVLDQTRIDLHYVQRSLAGTQR